MYLDKSGYYEMFKDCKEINNNILNKLKEIKMIAECRNDLQKTVLFESFQ